MGGGKVKGQLSIGAVVTSVVRERMGEAPAVQSGHALPMGRCARPPGCSYTSVTVYNTRSSNQPLCIVKM